MSEVWRDIEGYEGRYQVSSMGRVKSLVRKGRKRECILDEWQNISSKNCVSAYKKVKRNYTIGLSATPIRKKGENF